MMTLNNLPRFAVLAFLAFPFGAAVALADSSAPHVPDCSWTLQDGKQIATPRQFHGKVLYVDFWASWCAPCVLSFPFMNELQSSFAGQDLQIVGVDMDAKPDDAQHFLAQHPAAFSIAAGANAQCAKNFGVTAMPSSFIVDRSGAIRFVHRGFRLDDAKEIRAEVKQLLAEKPAG